MVTTLTKQEPQALSTWSAADESLIREMFAKSTTDAEFRLFAKLAQRFELDPFAKQIWCIKYGTQPAAIFASRDGFLAIAHRSGLFDGMETDAEYDDQNNVTRATCRVWRKDMSHPITVSVPMYEYFTPGRNGNKSNWEKLPETMLKKVAESHALRRAFNVSGIYAPEEMDQARQDMTERTRTVVVAEPVEQEYGAPQSTRRQRLIARIEQKMHEADDSGVSYPPAPDFSTASDEALEGFGLAIKKAMDEQAAFLAGDLVAKGTTPEGIKF